MKIRIVQYRNEYRLEKKNGGRFGEWEWLACSTCDTIERCQELVEDIKKGKRFIEEEELKEKIPGDGDVIQEFDINNLLP